MNNHSHSNDIAYVGKLIYLFIYSFGTYVGKLLNTGAEISERPLKFGYAYNRSSRRISKTTTPLCVSYIPLAYL